MRKPIRASYSKDSIQHVCGFKEQEPRPEGEIIEMVKAGEQHFWAKRNRRKPSEIVSQILDEEQEPKESEA